MDCRFVRLKSGLEQLTDAELEKLLATSDDGMVYDEYYYRDGLY